MNQENCFELGHITKTHGLDGFLTVFLDSDLPEEYYNIESVLLEIKGELIPYFIEDHKETNNTQKVNFLFEEVDSTEKAEQLLGTKLFLPIEALPDLGENKFYYHEIIGFEILNNNKPVGTIQEVFENTGSDFFVIEKEVLIPIEDDFILIVDKVKKQISMNLPEGLLEL